MLKKLKLNMFQNAIYTLHFISIQNHKSILLSIKRLICMSIKNLCLFLYVSIFLDSGRIVIVVFIALLFKWMKLNLNKLSSKLWRKLFIARIVQDRNSNSSFRA